MAARKAEAEEAEQTDQQDLQETAVEKCEAEPWGIRIAGNEPFWNRTASFCEVDIPKPQQLNEVPLDCMHSCG